MFLTRDFEICDGSETRISKGDSEVHPIPTQLQCHQHSAPLSSESKQEKLYIRHNKILSAVLKVILCFENIHILLGVLALKR